MTSFLKIILPFLLVICCISEGKAQNTHILVDTNVSVIDANYPPFDSLRPGDTIFLQPGPRRFLLIRYLQGEPGKPIVITNYGGPVIINTDHYFGISIQGCRYFRLTGTGDPDTSYGIRIEGVARGGGIGVGFRSSDFELDHLSVMNCLTSGIVAKTEPSCSPGSSRGEFTQYNTIIHDNYVANIGNEGMYIGSSKYFGQIINCNGIDVTMMPPLLEGVRIYNNIVENTAMDAIQVGSSSTDCLIYDNFIKGDGQGEMFAQMSGITIGGGSRCDCYNNYITGGKGNGIEIHGLGGLKVFNNIIVDAGKSFQPDDLSKMRFGIYVSDASVLHDSAFYIIFNTIVNPKSDGIRFNSVNSANNLIVANVIINPGNFDLYENDNTSFEGYDSYVMLQDPLSDVTFMANYFARNLDGTVMSAPAYAPGPGSLLIDGNILTNLGIDFDFYHNPRPVGNGYDIGAVEFDQASMGFDHSENELPETLVFPNPADRWIHFVHRITTGGEIVLKVYNELGMQVLQYKSSGRGGTIWTYNLELESFDPGIYYYSITGKNLNDSGKFIRK
jgi:hypothetical protein